MKASVLFSSLTFLLIILSHASRGQKQGLDSIPATPLDVFEVSMEGQGFMKMQNLRFGGYYTVSFKNKPTRSRSKSNIWNTKSESTATSGFSFAMCFQDSDTVSVVASRIVRSKSQNAFKVSENFSVGTNEVISGLDSLSATITLSRDTAWILNMHTSNGKEGPETSYWLAGGSRKFNIRPARSDGGSRDKRLLPAMGYEFVTNDSLYAAVEYFGGGVSGAGKRRVWIARIPDQHLRLVLAAACTAILYNKMANMSPAE